MWFVATIHPSILTFVTLLRIEKGRENRNRSTSPKWPKILAPAKIPAMDRSTSTRALAAPCKRAPMRPKVYDMGRFLDSTIYGKIGRYLGKR